jgi:hypothetical protein
MLRIDNTIRSSANTCLRKYYFEYRRHLVPTFGSTALRYGIAWHAAMEAVYEDLHNGVFSPEATGARAIVRAAQAWKECTDKQDYYDDYRTFENLVEALSQYMNHYTAEFADVVVLELEKPFAIEMVPTASQAKIYNVAPFYFTGKLDGRVEEFGAEWVLENKTTGRPISIARAQLNRSAQFVGYSFASGIPQVMVNFHQLNSTKSRKTGEYGKVTINFSRDPQVYTPEVVAEWKESLFETAGRIQNAIRHNNYTPNFDNCFQFGRCRYANLCEQYVGVERVNTEGFTEREPWDVAKELF